MNRKQKKVEKNNVKLQRLNSRRRDMEENKNNNNFVQQNKKQGGHLLPSTRRNRIGSYSFPLKKQNKRDQETSSSENETDEIKDMIRSMCNHAFKKKTEDSSTSSTTDTSNNSYNKMNKERNFSGEYWGEACLYQPQLHARSLDEYPYSNTKLRDHDEYHSHHYNDNVIISSSSSSKNHPTIHTTQSNERNFGAEIKNIDLNNGTITDECKMSALLMLKRKTNCKVNEHLKTLGKAEEEMTMKLKSAKNKLVDCIQALQLHHDNLMEKEKQYLIYLNRCRQNILVEAKEYYEGEARLISK